MLIQLMLISGCYHLREVVSMKKHCDRVGCSAFLVWRSPDRADAVKYALLQAISMYAPNPRSQAAALGKVSEWG